MKIRIQSDDDALFLSPSLKNSGVVGRRTTNLTDMDGVYSGFPQQLCRGSR
jgi:hypothetical protein